MLLQALAEYADHYLADELNDVAWETKSVPLLLEISSKGKFMNVLQRSSTVMRGKNMIQIPALNSVPRSPVNRASGDYPLLGTDDIGYILGVGAWTPNTEAAKRKEQRHNKAFILLLAKAAAETGDSALTSCIHFYSHPKEVEKARFALREVNPGTIVGLSVDKPLGQREIVRQFWREHFQREFYKRMMNSEGECMVSGKFGPIALTHEKIKGLTNLGGQASGVSLISFAKDAFCSYGWKQNRNSPVSPDKSLAYVLAFNDLLKQHKGRRKDLGGIGFLSWLESPADLNVFNLMEEGESTRVKNLLDLNPRDDLDTNRLYLVAVSGNGGRLRLHHWAELTLKQVKSNLHNWHQQLRIEYPHQAGRETNSAYFWQLLNALDREGVPNNQMVIVLMRRGIEGIPLGYSVLSKALTRLRQFCANTERTEHEARAKKDPMSIAQLRVSIGLIRMCINDIFRQQKGGTEMSEGLDTNCQFPAYICGRMMAVFENLQRRSGDGEMNSSILNRYFGLASTYPAVAFPKIERFAQRHLQKLRKYKPATAYAIDKRLQELHNLLQPSVTGAFPGKLGLEDQGLFALGYYHQKARFRSEARDFEKTREAAKEFFSEYDDPEKN